MKGFWFGLAFAFGVMAALAIVAVAFLAIQAGTIGAVAQRLARGKTVVVARRRAIVGWSLAAMVIVGAAIAADVSSSDACFAREYAIRSGQELLAKALDQCRSTPEWRSHYKLTARKVFWEKSPAEEKAELSEQNNPTGSPCEAQAIALIKNYEEHGWPLKMNGWIQHETMCRHAVVERLFRR